MDYRHPKPGRCRAAVDHRDTYRYSGGPHRFRMHYRQEQCKRKPRDNGYCWQHQYLSKEAPDAR